MTTSSESRAAIPLAKPSLTGTESERVLEVLASGQLALGPELRHFERRMAARCGTRHAIAVSSGTAALHLIVRALGIGDGDDVLTTPYSFVASSNAALFEDARPRFADVDAHTLNLDVERLEARLTPRTRAILAVDVFGLPADWPALRAFADAHDLFLIDDACEGLGASVAGQPIGSWGDAAAFGFYPNKQITTGEGGCITTDSEELVDACRSLRNQGRASDARMEHVRLGYNYRLSELQATVGCAQLERLDDLLSRRTQVAARYHEALGPLADDLVLPPDTAENATRSWFVYVVRLRDHFDEGARDRLMAALREQKVGCAPYFPCIHLQPYYRERFGYAPGDFPVAEAASARTLALPFFPDMTPEQVERVAHVLESSLHTL